jgi:hypothetical protein
MDLVHCFSHVQIDCCLFSPVYVLTEIQVRSWAVHWLVLCLGGWNRHLFILISLRTEKKQDGRLFHGVIILKVCI